MDVTQPIVLFFKYSPQVSRPPGADAAGEGTLFGNDSDMHFSGSRTTDLITVYRRSLLSAAKTV